ncbi:MAG: YesL family protein [Candidatus Limivicinus sp.]|jgi:uncharacterized membrane protein YesL
MKLFSPDSKFMQAMSRLADLAVINMMYVICCLPVITIGAASTALYTVCSKMVYNRDSRLYRTFFKSFKENFKDSTILWLIYLVTALVLIADIYFFSQMPSPISYAGILFCIFFLLLSMVVSYTFPLLCHFENTKLGTVKNALTMSLAYLPRTIIILVLNALPWVLLWKNMLMFLQTGFIWFFLYFSAAAYLNCLLLKKVFRPYLGEEEEMSVEDEK